MSIRIRFSLEPKRNLIFRIKRKNHSAERMVKMMAEDMGYRCFTLEGFLMVQLCPEGYLWFRENKKKLHGESQTNIAGPGFHVAVIDFLEEIAKKQGLTLKMEDKTGYYIKRDFLALRQKYFYQWFSDLIDMVSNWKDNDDYMFCWPTVYYVPERQKDRLITHIRSFSFKEMKGMVHSGMSVAFAKDFFIWNEIEKDAYFYRNSGMVLLNQSCFFMPSKRSTQDKLINQTIIESLEKALTIDNKIPFPKRQYLEVCRLADHEPVDLEKIESMDEDIFIGCRKNTIYRKIGNMSFGIPGNFLYDETESTNMDHYYDGKEYGGHDYFVYVAVFAGRPAEFKKPWFEQGEVDEILDFDVGEAKARVAFYKPQDLEGEIVYGMSAQVLYGEQRMNINILSRKPGERDWALELINNIKVIE